MGDMDSHYDIEPRDGGFALVRTFEIDDEMLAEMGLPAEQEHGWTKTLAAMYDLIVRREGPFVGVQTPEPSREEAELGSPERDAVVLAALEAVIGLDQA